jgi:Xaa-Pro aminopeptidase
MVRPGTLVREIEHEIEKLFEKYGCSMPSFPAEAIVLGPMSGPVFGMNYDRVEKGYSFAFDFGGVYQGYCSDFGRTVFVGEPNPEIVRYYELVRAAQKAGLEAFRPGISTCEEINLAARKVIEEAGYGENFIHRLGHGIGKDVHERPFLAMGEKTITMPGMTFTDEPSIVFVRRCCVRLEDVVLVTESGCEDLNAVTKELVVVD